MPTVAALHLQRVRGVGIVSAMAHMALDRRLLGDVDGLRFWKLLGTGRGTTFRTRDADPTTWGLFTVWDDHDALRRFEAGHRVARSWERRASQQWSVHLRPLRWRGAWGGREPFGPSVAAGAAGEGPVAALTRARIRPSQWAAFRAAVPPAARAVSEAPGLQCAVGIGEAPIGLQATFSLWRSAADLDRYAYGGDAHRAVIRATRTRAWYSEEMFTRFAVLEQRGAIDGLVR
jgi:heme-degrading monooxygenase HmoA